MAIPTLALVSVYALILCWDAKWVALSLAILSSSFTEVPVIVPLTTALEEKVASPEKVSSTEEQLLLQQEEDFSN